MSSHSHSDRPAADSFLRGMRLDRRALLQRAGLLGAGLLVSPAILEACGSSPSAGGGGGGTPRKGGTATWGQQSDPVALSPFGSTNGSQFEITSLMYESLLTWDRNLNIKPALATSYDIPDDHTYVFHLRKGVKFHSGKELDANDVKYSLDLQKSPPPPGVINSFYPKIATVETPDPHTVRITMAAPDATMLGYLAWGRYSWIVPQGFYEQGDTRTRADGTGPFKLHEYVPNDHTTLSRHTGYWNPDRPYLDGVVMKVLQDEQARVAAVRSGAIQGTTVTADTAQILSRDSNLRVLKGLTATFRELELKLNGHDQPWTNVKVRQAVNFAINRQEIIDKVYAGDAVYSGKIPPGFGQWALSADDLKNRYEKYDLAKAKQLMSEAGFGSGFSVTLQSISAPDDYTKLAEVVKQQLKRINVDVTVQPLEIATFAKNNSRGDFEWQSTGRGMRGDPSGFIADFDPSSAIYKAWYLGGYKNDELQNLYFQGLRTPKAADRMPIYRQIQQIILTEWPAIPTVDPMKYQVVSGKLHGMNVSYDDTERGLIDSWLA